MSVKRLLVCTDFSEHSEAALSYAVSVAERFGSELTAVHVVLDAPLFYAPFVDNAGSYVEALDKGREEMEERLEEFCARANPDGFNVHPLLLSGVPYVEIVKASEEGFDLVVMSTRGLHGVQGILVGSTARRVVRNARCPVLSVRNPVERPWRPRRFLVTSDLSENSLPALRLAKSFAGVYDATLTLFHVIETGAPLDESTREELARNVVSSLKAQTGHDDIRVIVEERALSGIVSAAEDYDAVFTATHGRSGLEHVLLGSVAEEVVRDSPVPVVTVHSFA